MFMTSVNVSIPKITCTTLALSINDVIFKLDCKLKEKRKKRKKNQKKRWNRKSRVVIYDLF